MMRIRWIALLLVGIVLAAYVGVSWYFASVVIVFTPAERSPEWIARYAPPWDVPLTENVEFQSGDNLIVADVYDNPAEADCAVIIVHGLGGERSLVRQYGPVFWELGCDVMSYDFAAWHNDVPLTYGATEKDDLLNVLQWYSEYTGFPTSQIGIWAESFGAATTLLMLPEQSDLAWVISDSVYSSMQEIISYQAVEQFGDAIRLIVPGAFFVSELRAGFSRDDAAPIGAVADLDLPLLLIHSTADDFTPPENSQAVYDAANPETTRLVFTDWGAGHAQSYIENKPEYTAIIYDFLADFAPDFGDQSSLE